MTPWRTRGSCETQTAAGSSASRSSTSTPLYPAFDVARCGTTYFRALLQRLRDLSGLTVAEFRVRRSTTLRAHPIDFKSGHTTVRSFGVRGIDADKLAWQFALSANEHGRVHGFLVGDTFFVRWLDPDHNLYSRN